MKTIKADICVIGAGSGGLSFAAGAAQMGADVVLIEKGKMGGDCLNYGCVPSKSLIAASKLAHAVRGGDSLGVQCKNVKLDFSKTHKHVKDVIAGIAPHDSEARFRSLGVNVIKAHAKFIDKKTVLAKGKKITAKYFIIATGSSAYIPDIDGLHNTPYLTNEEIFSLRHLPHHLLVIGMGPIGCELAQAFARLGARVTLVSHSKLLPREDADAVKYVRKSLQSDNIKLLENVKFMKLKNTNGAINLSCTKSGKLIKTSASHLLVATGRKANIDDLNLQACGVETTNGVIKIDARLRTTNKRIYALGDVRGGGQFTHMAGYDAGIAIRNILFKLPAKATAHALLPRVTYTDPEVAAVGLSEAQAMTKYGESSIRITTANMQDNDRARTEKATAGMIKIITHKSKIIGACICGKSAGDLLLPWIMAITDGKKIGDMAGYIVPYPTLGEISKRAAGHYFTASLFSERTKRIVRFVMRYLS